MLNIFHTFASRINSTPYAKLKGNIIYLTSLQVSDKLEKFWKLDGNKFVLNFHSPI